MASRRPVGRGCATVGTCRANRLGRTSRVGGFGRRPVLKKRSVAGCSPVTAGWLAPCLSVVTSSSRATRTRGRYVEQGGEQNEADPSRLPGTGLRRPPNGQFQIVNFFNTQFTISAPRLAGEARIRASAMAAGRPTTAAIRRASRSTSSSILGRRRCDTAPSGFLRDKAGAR